MSIRRVCDNCEKPLGALAPYVITEHNVTGPIPTEQVFDLCSTKCISDWAFDKEQK